MKHYAIRLLIAVALIAGLHRASAQGTAFTYQGQLLANGALAGGNYDLTFALFATNSGGSPMAGPLTNSSTAISNGLFTVTLDFGNQFDGAARWLEIGVRTNGGGAFSTLAPRQALTPTPYAIMAGSASNFLGTLPPAQLSGTYSNQVAFNNGADSFDGTFSGQFFGSSFIGGNFVGNFVGSGDSLSDVWHTVGNFGTTPPVNFLGTTDDEPLVFKVNNQEAMRFEPTTDTPNVVGGWSGNYVQTGLAGVAIGGGGDKGANQPNVVTNYGYYGTIAGGYWNTVTNWGGAVLGGAVNYAGGYFAAIGAGEYHTNFGDYAFIGGGYANWIQTNNPTSFIGGGDYNTIQVGAYGAIIGGGYDSTIQTNADHAIVASGWQNLIETGAYESVIGGGAENDIGPYAQYAIIGGGNYNTNVSTYSTISGGEHNHIQANISFIGGGADNTIQSGYGDSVIGGGVENIIATNGFATTIGGGNKNSTGTNAWYATIAGGLGNVVSGIGATIGGGGPFALSNGNTVYFSPNQASGISATIPGGSGNKASGTLSFAAGTHAKALHDGTFVWADDQLVDFPSSGSNQFLIRASGGVGINTANPAGMTLSVNGPVGATSFNGSFTGDGTGVANVNAAKVGGLAASNLWQTGGNAGTSPANGNFLGTTDNQPLELRANGRKAFRLEPGGLSTVIGGTLSPNVVGGSDVNYVAPGIVGAVLAGGGGSNAVYSGFFTTNGINADFGVIGGGFGNILQSGAFMSTIAGGYQNTIQTNADSSVIAGGAANTIVGSTANSVLSIIGCGLRNNIQTNAVLSVIGGGYNNTIVSNASGATIPGGYQNLAGGFNSFAAGSYAQATNDGSFVWSDYSLTNAFNSTASNQFLVRAQNGVGINTNNPQSALHVNGTVTATAFSGSGANVANVNAATLGGIGSSGFWKTTGNAGTTPGVNFVGTTDNQALVLKGSFVGVGRSFSIGSEVFGVEAPVIGASYGGMYMDTSSSNGKPFYGYSQASSVIAYHYIDGADTNKWKLNIGAGDRLVVTTGGLVGIGTTVPDATLSVGIGTADKPGGGSWATFSDVRLKKNIAPLRGALDRLLQLRAVTFEYKDPQAVHELAGVQIGMIAQEVEKVFPDWVDTAPNGMKRLSIHGFEALTVQALRELRAEKDSRIAELEKKNAEIQQELADQKEANRRLDDRMTTLQTTVAKLAEKLDGTYKVSVKAGTPAPVPSADDSATTVKAEAGAAGL